MIITISEKEIKNHPNDSELGALIREKYFEITSKVAKDDTYDKCVICGKVSPYKFSQHIDTRIGYIEGAGQGCFQPSKGN